MHLVIVPSEIVDVARPPILGPLLLLAHDPGVLVAVVGDDAPAQDIVGDDEAAGAQQPRAAAGRRPGEDGVEVVRVAGLLGVDEDEVVRLAGSEGGERGQGVADAEVDVCDAVGGEGGDGLVGVGLVELEARHVAFGPDGVRPDEGGVADVDADFED